MPRDFSVVAIVAAYNEADVIGQVVGDLIEQGVQVYLLDDGSTDGTLAAVEPYRGRGLLEIERRGGNGPAADGFQWERILLRKAELARELDADWFIHHDADEFRESPWLHLSLRDAVRAVDALGYNAIDSARLDFWPVHDGFRPGDDVRRAFTHYAMPAPYDRLQIRCWKRTDALVDLVASGGHEVRFPGRRVFPIRFLLRHYPIRGQAHGERKVFRERKPRFVERERARGWHVQYDTLSQGASFIHDPATLTPYDAEAVRLSLLLRHRAVEEAEDAAAALRREVERAAEELARARAELAERTADVDRVRRGVDAATAEIARLRDVVEDGARRLADLHRSLSWRMTAPARAVGRLLGRG
jgi:glycosyltransferase involved in cell wall biosynthesis